MTGGGSRKAEKVEQRFARAGEQERILVFLADLAVKRFFLVFFRMP
jgi:hypothetical protein